MDFIYLLFTNILSVLLILLLFVIWKRLRNQFAQPVIFDLVAYFALSKLLLYFLLPAFLRMISDWKYEKEVGVMPYEMAMVYTIEFISYVFWMTTVFVITELCYSRRELKKRKKNSIAVKTLPGRLEQKQISLENHAKWFMVILCGLYLFFFPYTYDRALQPEGLAIFIKHAVMRAGAVVGLYLFSLDRRRIGNLPLFLGIIITPLSLMYGFAIGVRGLVIGPAMWLFFLYLVTRKKRVLFISIIGFLTIMVFYDVMHDYKLGLQFKPGSDQQSPIQVIQRFIDVRRFRKPGDSPSSKGHNLLSSMEFRFGEVSRMSVAFVRVYNAGQAAGWAPIKSSLYAPLPRRFFPGKPEPGSVDGTKEGMGMYMIQAVMRKAPWSMSDFFTGVHAYWELGLIGVVLFSVLSGIFIVFCTNYFGRFGLAGLPLMMVALKPWWNEPKLWISEIILDVVHILIPLILIWYLIRFGLDILRRIKKYKVRIFRSL